MAQSNLQCGAVQADASALRARLATAEDAQKQHEVGTALNSPDKIQNGDGQPWVHSIPSAPKYAPNI